jgi:DNA (cytosine-5)-methyltransferase 1
MPRTEEIGFGLWHTPTCDDASNVNPKPNRFEGLVAQVNKLFPTPQTQGLKVCVNGETKFWVPTPNAFDAVLSFGNRKDNNMDQGGRHGVSLRHLANGPLNPNWVEWLMGYPIGWTDLNS